MILNIRGANGSGKSTAARHFLKPTDNIRLVNLCKYETATGRTKIIIGYHNQRLNVVVVGDYSTMAGGMDKIPNFGLMREAILAALKISKRVICEGVIASTVFGSWADFTLQLKKQGETFAWVYIEPPLKVCLERIQARNNGKPIKEGLVADKVKSVRGTKEKALRAGFRVYQLPLDLPGLACENILRGFGRDYRVRPDGMVRPE